MYVTLALKFLFMMSMKFVRIMEMNVTLAVKFLSLMSTADLLGS